VKPHHTCMLLEGADARAAHGARRIEHPASSTGFAAIAVAPNSAPLTGDGDG
jgi:hypothetical protein